VNSIVNVGANIATPHGALREMDRHSAEQQRLLRRYHLERADANEKDAGSQWSAAGPRSVAPFVPCASGRVGPALRASQLTSSDVLWDLGCGDGRLLHQAAVQYGCRCVGVDIDESCIAEARARAEEQGVAHLVQFEVCDMLLLQPGCLSTGELGAAAMGEASERALPPPTALLMFLTGHGLTRIADLLHAAWRAIGKSRGLRIVTCMEALDSLLDFEAGDGGLFDGPSFDWPVCRAFASDGIFVVPPLGTSAQEWADRLPALAPLLSPEQADGSAPVRVEGLLSEAEERALELFGEAMRRKQAPDTAGSAEETGVVYLHRGGAIQDGWVQDMQEECVEALLSLERVVERLLAAMRRSDAEWWRLLVGRSAVLRSVAYHADVPPAAGDDAARASGAVLAGGLRGSGLERRDGGSLLTLFLPLGEGAGAVLLLPPESQPAAPAEVAFGIGRGGGALFVSEKRHCVSPALAGRSSYLVVELWDGPPTLFDRHS